MTYTELEYFALNRILLLIVGLWPYQRSKLVQLQSILLSGIMSTFIMFQFTTFITSECTPDLVITVFSSTFFLITIVVGYNTFFVRIETMKCLLEQLRNVYNELEDPNEIALMEKYGRKANRETISFIIFGMCVVLIFVFFQSGWNIFNVSINESGLYLPFLTEYFFDQDKYSYLIWWHMNISILIAVIASLAITVTLRKYLLYVCAMFQIASYRFEQAVSVDVIRNIKLEIENVIYTRLINAVNIHRKAMKLSELLASCFETLLFILMMMEVTLMSLNTFRIFQMSFEFNIQEIILHTSFALATLIHMFLVSYAGQEITDHSNCIFIRTYNTRWYKIPLNMQRLILFLLQRGNKVFVLSVGGLFVLSLENFTTLISVSISYFTVLYSIWK